MDYKIGFIGSGKMVTHIVNGFLDQPGMKERIVVVGRDREKLERFNIGKEVEISTDFKRLTPCSIIVVGVSAQAAIPMFRKLNEIKTDMDTIFMSIAAGVSIEDIASVLPDKKVVRCMPNIAVSSSEGVMVMAANNRIGLEEQHSISDAFGGMGTVEWIDEDLMKYVPALTGSSPAYAFLMIEAMADKAVSVGFSRKQAYRLAAQALVGAGKLVLDADTHPGVLKDQITTSGGSTIQGVMKLEQEGFRGSVMQAMQAVNDANEK
ncbi:pyrroline-5-carboxylate reductase [Salinicoccus sp. HZC-1]|uniref:pyrroline-5-carboxylate reductase n=1 Tax=Salinicoccus sp. HZC-1 TaxID=3385497 RepID=UPI00398B9474